MSKKTTISGKDLYYYMLAGAKNLINKQYEINKLNIFPVPDADTGTNLASTFRSIVSNITHEVSFKNMSASIAFAAVENARGNSGVIFAQFLHGFNSETKNETVVNSHQLAISLKKAVNHVYEALTEPMEGTMLTVMREWANAFYELKDKYNDIYELFYASIERAKVAVYETQNKIKQLTGKKIVDAGAKGFFIFLEGIASFSKTNIRDLVESTSHIELLSQKEEEHNFTEKSDYQFCSEVLIQGKNIDSKKLRQEVTHLGNSIVVAGGGENARLHIHTDKPADCFSIAAKHGKMIRQKIDDLHLQYEIINERKSNIAIVTDSACDLPQDLLDRYQVHIAPLSIYLNGHSYLDKLTLTSEELYSELESGKVLTTSQPGDQAFRNLYTYLLAHYDAIISIHMTSKMSGTVNNAKRMAPLVAEETGKRIEVIDSTTISGSLGLIVSNIGQMLERGEESMDSLLIKVRELINRTDLYVSPFTLKHMIRSGRVSPFKGLVAKLFNIFPVIAMREGKPAQLNKAFSRGANRKKIMKLIETSLKNKKVDDYIIVHASNKEHSEWFREKMFALTGKEPMAITEISPTIGTHVGRGSIGIGFISDSN